MNRLRYSFLSVAILTCIILLLFGLYVFPLPGTDSVVYIPTAWLYSKGYGLVNPLYYVTNLTDPTHTSQFNYYVPFFPMFLGFMARLHPGIKTLFFICSLFSIANLLLYYRSVTALLPQRTTLAQRALLLLSVTYIATYLLPTVGRPETFTTIMVFAISLLFQRRQSIHPLVYNLAICILFGLMFATQIICFYFCFLFFVTYELLHNTATFRVIGINLLRFAAALAIFCATLQLSPIGLVGTIKGIIVHLNIIVLGRADRSIPLFIRFWVIAPLNFGFLFLFLTAATYYFKTIIPLARVKSALHILAIITLQLMIAYGVVKYILYASPTVYNATQFILPLTVFLIGHLLRSGEGWGKKVATYTVLATYVCGTLFFTRTIILFIDNQADGKDFTRARGILAGIIQKQNLQNHHKVYVTNSIWPLPFNPYKVHFYDGAHADSGDIIVVQQANHEIPMEWYEGKTVIYDWQTKPERKFLGIKLTNHPQGYSFVVFRQD